MNALKEFKVAAKMIHKGIDSHTKFVSIDSRINIFAESKKNKFPMISLMDVKATEIHSPDDINF